MSYKYRPLHSHDQSSSFFGQQEANAFQDLTNHVFQMAQKSRNLSNVNSFSKHSSLLP